MRNFFESTHFLNQILNGFGQVMLQKNRVTGCVFIVGIFESNWLCGLGGVLSAAAGCLAARILKFSQQEIDDGLYAFSPSLVGVALVLHFGGSAFAWALVILGGFAAAILQHFFLVRKIPAFTLPFILVTWVLIFGARQIPIFQDGPSDSRMIFGSLGGMFAGTNGFGEVILQSSALSGMLFFLGVFISSPLAALYGLTASFLGAAIAQVSGQSVEMIHAGLFGFNATLTAIVFSGDKKADGAWVLVGVTITVMVDIFFHNRGAFSIVGGALTLPFVIGTWITLAIRKIAGYSKLRLSP